VMYKEFPCSLVRQFEELGEFGAMAQLKVKEGAVAIR
jgi:hypothetical protein